MRITLCPESQDKNSPVTEEGLQFQRVLFLLQHHILHPHHQNLLMPAGTPILLAHENN